MPGTEANGVMKSNLVSFPNRNEIPQQRLRSYVQAMQLINAEAENIINELEAGAKVESGELHVYLTDKVGCVFPRLFVSKRI